MRHIHRAIIIIFLNQRPKRADGNELYVKRLLELIAYSTPHDAELLADCGAETESGTALSNGIGQCHIVVVDIDE